MKASRRYQRWMSVADNHGDMADPLALAATWDFKNWFKPTIRIHKGDCFDMRPLRKKADKQEQQEDPNPDMDAGLDFIGKFKPTHFLLGNHEARLWDLAKSENGTLRSYAQSRIDTITDALGDKCQVYPYDKRNGVMSMGHLSFIHGYHSGLYAAKQAAQIYGNVAMGHTHAIDAVAIPGLERRMGYCTGCLCQLSMDYNRAQANTLRQSHGFAYGLSFENGEFLYFQAAEVNGTWYFPSEFREFRPNLKQI